ncbi:MAG: NAD-dependent epimerase/dehydratase family protein [Planctomycetia bacterium]|nr:NAD-dependent epimerase/dehydratase family protein [Planctomycetia bacterium]
MRSLVTGAGGFLGQYLTEKLVARGENVRAFCRGRYDALDRLGVETVRGDLEDIDLLRKACKGVDVVYHTAAISGIGEPWGRYWRTNTLGTENLLDAAVGAGVGKFVYTSSPSVTFDGGDQLGVDETVPYPRRWLAHYPHSKALAEERVLSMNPAWMLTCALRPHLIWGPRDRALIPRLIARARAGRLRRVGDGTNRVDMIYVENAADAHLQAADAMRDEKSPNVGRAYFLSQGEPVNCWEWIDEILVGLGMAPIDRSVSLSTAMNVGRVCEWVWKLFRWKSDPPMTRFLALQLAKNHYFDISAAKRDFGYEPKISTEEGMRRLLAYFRETKV